MPNTVTNSIDDNGVLFLYNKIKGEMPTKTSDLANDSTFQTATQVATSINTAIQALSIPDSVSDLTNDLNFQTQTEVQTLINTAIATIEDLHIDWSRSELPATGNTKIIYAIPTGDADDPYDFWVWNDTAAAGHNWVKLDFKIDMSGYMKTSDIHWMTNAEIDALLSD